MKCYNCEKKFNVGDSYIEFFNTSPCLNEKRYTHSGKCADKFRKFLKNCGINMINNNKPKPIDDRFEILDL